MGFSPFDVQAWLLPKAVLSQFVIGQMGQNAGVSGRDISWLSFQADSPFDWMMPSGADYLKSHDYLLNGLGPF